MYDKVEVETSYPPDSQLQGRRLSKYEMRSDARSMRVHHRKAYSLQNLCEEIGGISEIIFLLGFFIIAPFSEHGFVLRAITKFYVMKETNVDNEAPNKFLDESTRNPLTTPKTQKLKMLGNK